MSLWTLVPMRGLAVGKSRLASVLDSAERSALNRMMLDRVLDAVASVEGCLDRCVVASASADALALARRHGAVALEERPDTGLNAALEIAREYALASGATAILTLAADLPDVTGSALRRFLCGSPVGAAAVIADKLGRGTNGLLIPATSSLRFAFGDGSLARHVAAFRSEGREVFICRDPSLAFDLDSPADHSAWRARTHRCAASAS